MTALVAGIGAFLVALGARWAWGLFLECIVMALADVLAEFIGWLARRWWKRRKKRKNEESE